MANLKIHWVLPTTRFPSGRDLPIDEIAGVLIELSADEGATYGALGTFIPAVLETTVTDLDVGTWFVRGTTIDTKGRASRKPLVKSVVVEDDSPPGELLSLDLVLS